MNVLKTCLINGGGIENRRFSQLNSMRSSNRVESTFGEIETTNSHVIRSSTRVVIARNQRVVCIDRVVESRTEVRVSFWYQKALTNLLGIQRGIKDRCANQLVVASVGLTVDC